MNFGEYPASSRLSRRLPFRDDSRERGVGHENRVLKFLGVAFHRIEVGQRLQRQGVSALLSRRPEDHLGRGMEAPGEGLVAWAPVGRRFLGFVERREVVRAIDDDAGNSPQRRFLDKPIEQHGLARAGTRKDNCMLGKGVKWRADVLAVAFRADDLPTDDQERIERRAKRAY